MGGLLPFEIHLLMPVSLVCFTLFINIMLLIYLDASFILAIRAPFFSFSFPLLTI